MLAVLAETRALLALPGNDFSWSSFLDAEAALAELDGYIDTIRAGDPPPPMLRVLFAATGPIQEVALSSGWADEYLAVADRFDAAVSVQDL